MLAPNLHRITLQSNVVGQYDVSLHECDGGGWIVVYGSQSFKFTRLVDALKDYYQSVQHQLACAGLL